MKQIYYIILLCSSILLIANACQNQNPQTKKIIIAGKILNFKNHQEHETLEIHFRDLLELNESNIVQIDEKGEFSTEKTCSYPQDFFIIYGTITRLFCSPGDSLFVEIDADIWKDKNNKNPNGEYFIRVTGGTSVQDNEYVRRFDIEILRNLNVAEEIKKITESTPFEYKEHIYKTEELYFAILDSFVRVNKTSKLFRKWAEDYIQYDTWNNLMRYRWLNPHYNRIARDSFNVPKEYFTFLQEYDMDDNDVISIHHNDFLNEYFTYVYYEIIPADSLEKAKQLYNKGNKADYYTISMNNIRRKSSGFTRDVFIAKTYASLLKWKMIDDFEAIYNPETIQSSFLRKQLESEYENFKSFQDNPQLISDTYLYEIGSDIIKPILDTIIARYKGNVIYIDFWAPWCGPCMGEMPYSKKIQEQYAKKDIVFIFLAALCTEKSWKGTLAEKQMTGEHFLLSDDQYNVLKSMFGITGIPHYVLVDKKGRVINNNAPRPSDDKRLSEEIDKLL
jgi:thiol-disulfide isomerase/thioredoxin